MSGHRPHSAKLSQVTATDPNQRSARAGEAKLRHNATTGNQARAHEASRAGSMDISQSSAASQRSMRARLTPKSLRPTRLRE